MKIKHSLKTAFTGLKTNRLRSLLTILGIVIGITAIILLMSVGQGAENLILDQIRGLGSQTIIVEPGREPQGPSDFGELFTDSLKDRDVEALKNPSNVRGLKEITPMVMQVVSVSFENETKRTSVIGASDFIAKILEIYPAQGNFFTDEDIKQRASVAVIGADVKEKLFGLSDAIGQKIKIKNKLFRVIGVLPAKGRVAMFNADDIVAVPYTTAQKYLLGINYYHALLIQAESEQAVPQVASEIRTTLREIHGITDPDKDDFHVTTQADAVQRVGMITTILTVLLVSIAAISLIVGGIGIMNIMLVSVTERTQEIGLRKAIGATEKDVLVQFLFESVILTVAGGVTGIILGIGFSFIASVILARIVSLGWSFTIPVSAVILGFGVSLIIGLIFGLYPARQAASKSPMEALRYE